MLFLQIKQSRETHTELRPNSHTGHVLFAFFQVLYYIVAVTLKMNELRDYGFLYPYRLPKIGNR